MYYEWDLKIWPDKQDGKHLDIQNMINFTKPQGISYRLLKFTRNTAHQVLQAIEYKFVLPKNL